MAGKNGLTAAKRTSTERILVSEALAHQDFIRTLVKIAASMRPSRNLVVNMAVTSSSRVSHVLLVVANRKFQKK